MFRIIFLIYIFINIFLLKLSKDIEEIIEMSNSLILYKRWINGLIYLLTQMLVIVNVLGNNSQFKFYFEWFFYIYYTSLKIVYVYYLSNNMGQDYNMLLGCAGFAQPMCWCLDASRIDEERFFCASNRNHKECLRDFTIF